MFTSDRLLTLGHAKADAAVYKITDDLYGVFTVDILSPIVDMPYEYGQIVFANCISDALAMGAKPILALNVSIFPGKIDVATLGQILRGCADSAIADGVLIAGGHTAKDAELKYGLAVFGLVKPDELRTADSAKPGDHIIITKGIGTGILFAASKHIDVQFEKAIQSMTQTSTVASQVLAKHGVKCCTDVTGFGLAVTLLEVFECSKVGGFISASKFPLLPNAAEASKSYTCPVLMDNIETAGNRFVLDGAEPYFTNIVFDAQTSGGLLAFVKPELAAQCVADLVAAGYQAADIGEVTKGDIKVVLKP